MSKALLEKLYYHGLDTVKATNTVRQNISCDESSIFILDKKVPINSFKNLYIFSVGKAGHDMAMECEEILGSCIFDGLAISLSDTPLQKIQVLQSSHPILSQKSINCGEKLIEMVSSMDEEDYFIFFLSGGASAMIEKPIDNLSLEEFQKISKALIGSGIDIKALNSVRKSISHIKGGKLANKAKGQGRVLVLSDVIGDDLHTIGSAPMNNGKFEHTIIGNNTLALQAIQKLLEDQLDAVELITSTLDLPSPQATQFIKQKIEEYNKSHESFCLLFGGETTTKIVGDGLGGRNQELALRLLLEDCIEEDIFILCAGSDGIDGNSPATGAFLDFTLKQKLSELKLNPKEYLDNSDSYSFFKTLNYDFTTGASGTNVMDFVIVVKSNEININQ